MLGRHHPLVRRLRALRRDAGLRRAEGVYVAEGLHLAAEAIHARAPVELAVYSPGLRESVEGLSLLQKLRDVRIPHSETTPQVMESLQDARSPQPLLLLVRQVGHTLEPCLPPARTRPLFLVTCGIQDPGNLGTILRSADASGAAALLVTGESADLFHPRCVRASMGSIFRQPTVSMKLDPLLDLLRDRGVETVAADPSRGEPYDAVDLTGPVALFLGREGTGLPRDVSVRLDRAVAIPMSSGVESLSVGAAAAVLLFEAARQRRAASPTHP
jgi:TrmH family RNA methyltransferase